MKAAIVAVAIVLFHAGAFGQGYPGKPIRIMVGFSEFDAYIRGEVAKFQKIVKDAGIKPE
ncbi:MAG TPA: hypothetical protein VEQ87_19955 [Burkholderiales bacterium]|nr:hypothetical protein [Burkholderiales bacterium]